MRRQPPSFSQQVTTGIGFEGSTSPLGPESSYSPIRIAYGEIQELAGVDFTANITSGSKQVTITANSALATNFAVGYSVIAVGIPAGTTIASIEGPTQFTLSAAATATTSGVAMRANIVGVRGTAFTGNITNGSAVVANSTVNTASMTVGHSVTGIGIPSGATILNILTPTSFTLSVNATTTIVGNPMRTGIAASGSVAYCWQEVSFSDHGVVSVNIHGLASGGVCTPLLTQGKTGYAWEVNGNDELIAGTIVRLEPSGALDAAGESWRIVAVSGAGATESQAFVKVTSITSDGGRYPAALLIHDATGNTWATGEVVWYVGALGTGPVLNSYHLCKLVGTVSGVKVYSDAPVMCWVRVTSLTPDGTTGYYPAVEVYFDSDKDSKAWSTGNSCWFWTPNGETPVDETRYLCYLQGTDGEASPLKVYMAMPGTAGGGTELKGLTFTSDTGSTADSDPGAGLFKWNNATQASATELYFDDLTLDGASVTTFFASVAQSGFLLMQQRDDETKQQLWKWTAVTDAVGYTKLSVVYQTGLGSIADDKAVMCLFMSEGPDERVRATGAGSTGHLDEKLAVVWNDKAMDVATDPEFMDISNRFGLQALTGEFANIQNTDAGSGSGEANWMQAGNVLTVSGLLQIETTSASMKPNQFYDFPLNRLWNTPNGGPPVYADAWSTDVRLAPFFYFSSRRGGDYADATRLHNANGVNVLPAGNYTRFDTGTPINFPIVVSSMPLIDITGKHVNPNGYQIISAGKNGLIGPGGNWRPGQAPYSVSQPGFDDQSSLRSSPLGLVD